MIEKRGFNMNDTLCFKSPYKINCKLQIGYKQIYKSLLNDKNDYSMITKFNEIAGLYFFVSNNCDLLYIGQSSNLSERIKQHFQDNDSGGLRYKLQNQPELLEEINDSTLYVFPYKGSEGERSKAEESFVKLYQPKINEKLK